MLGNIFQPFTSMQELNLDWILTKIKNMLRFLPDDGAVGQILRRTAHGAEWSDEQGAGGSVTSVNGMQGAVVLDYSDVGALPDTYAAPVDSVNGQTGPVVLDASDVGALPDTYAAPVDSVNGQTGTVVLDASDVGALPDTYAAPVDSVNGQTGTVVLDASDVGALPDSYVAPVTSVNGQTGAVVITEPKYSDATEITGTVAVSSNNATGTWRMDYWGNWAWVYVELRTTANISVGGTITGTLTNFPTGYNPMTRGVGWLGSTMALFNVGADGSLFVRITVAQANSGNIISAFMLMSL